MRVGSLFAGIGGFDLAAESLGMRVLWQSETDKFASAVLDHHWPGLNLGDVHGISITDPSDRCDLMVGGFPCQSYSVAGNGGGLADDRGAVWWEFHRLIREGQPTWVVGENVPNLLASNGGRDFATIINSLVDLGYGLVWRVLDAQWFGVPQRRRRLFIVGHSGGRPRPEVLDLAASLSGDPAPSREEGQTPTGTLISRTTAGGGLGSDFEMDGGLQPLLADTGVVRSLTQRFGEAGSDLTDAEGGHLVVNTRQDPIVSDVVQPIDTGSRFGQAVMSFAENQRAEVLEGDVVRSITSGGGKPGQGYPAVRVGGSVRRLTPLECQRLQGFPDDFYDGIEISDKQKYRQQGNAVCVPVARWVLNRIKEDQSAS